MLLKVFRFPITDFGNDRITEGREREKGGEFWFFKISSLFLQLIKVKIEAATSLIH